MLNRDDLLELCKGLFGITKEVTDKTDADR